MIVLLIVLVKAVLVVIVYALVFVTAIAIRLHECIRNRRVNGIS